MKGLIVFSLFGLYVIGQFVIWVLESLAAGNTLAVATAIIGAVCGATALVVCWWHELKGNSPTP